MRVVGLDSAVKKIIHGLPEAEWKEPVKDCGFEIAETVRHAGQVILKLVVDAERLSIFNRIRQKKRRSY